MKRPMKRVINRTIESSEGTGIFLGRPPRMEVQVFVRLLARIHNSFQSFRIVLSLKYHLSFDPGPSDTSECVRDIQRHKYTH